MPILSIKSLLHSSRYLETNADLIESGVWKGQTTWLIKNVLKNSKIFSIDIDLSQRDLIYKNVKYLEKDITKYNWSKLDKNKTCLLYTSDAAD